LYLFDDFLFAAAHDLPRITICNESIALGTNLVHFLFDALALEGYSA
jgi:hypothetical protein